MKTFTEQWNGTLYGLLHWAQWDTVRAHIVGGAEAWYVYAVGQGVPPSPLTGITLRETLAGIDALLRRDHEEAYLGIVYVDDLLAPSLVKIYDPNNLGASCGSSGRSIPPGWVLSRQPPSRIASDIPLPNNRRRWWQALMSRSSAT